MTVIMLILAYSQKDKATVGFSAQFFSVVSSTPSWGYAEFSKSGLQNRYFFAAGGAKSCNGGRFLGKRSEGGKPCAPKNGFLPCWRRAS
jgi:hypothetical protein